MRGYGIERTRDLDNLTWLEGTGEQTGCPDNRYHLVSFGSSFNVVDRQKALAETRRIAVPGGWFTCLWNHRDLEDPIQKGIEDIIRKSIPQYGYGKRREDQGPYLEDSGYFREVTAVTGRILHTQTIEACVEAWRSHATLARQAGDDFPAIIDAIQNYLENLGQPSIQIPYTTVAWVAQLT